MRVLELVWAWGGTVMAMAVWIWAYWRGEWPERWVSTIMLVGWFVTPLVQHHPAVTPDIPDTIVDIIILVLFAAISVTSRRLWTVFLTAFQLNAVLSHFLAGLIKIGAYSYITAIGFWGGYCVVFALAAGVLGSERARKRKRALA